MKTTFLPALFPRVNPPFRRPQQVLFGRQQKEASERKTAAMNAARDALAGVGQKAKRGEHGEHDGDVSPNKPLQMLQVCVAMTRRRPGLWLCGRACVWAVPLDAAAPG